MPPHPMDISVVIVNWNTQDIVRDYLSSVVKQTQDIEFEVALDNKELRLCAKHSSYVYREVFPTF